MKTIATHWPLAAALLLFLAWQGVLSRAAVRAADGQFVYPLDDSYIQMAIGKNLAAHGVWGITRYEFSGAGSSLAWPVLLAAVNRVAGLDERTPFALNLIGALALLGLAYGVLKRHIASRVGQAGVLTLLIVATPLPVMVLIGMEHTFQIATTLALAASSVALCAASTDRERRRLLRWTLAAAAATVAVRYDSASVLAMVILIVFVMRGWRPAALIALCGSAPAAIYAVASRMNGWPLLPSSVLSKQRLAAIDVLTWKGFVDVAGGGVLGILLTEPALLVLVLAALAQLAWGAARADDDRAVERRLLLVIFIGATLIHTEFGRLGWRLYRYEAYLIALGIVANAAGLSGLPLVTSGWRRRPLHQAARAGLLVLILFPLLQRTLHASREVIAETRDLYRHKYQAGRFFSRYPVDGALLVSDLGIFAYDTDARIVDSGGLATRELIDMVSGPTYDDDLVLRVARQRGVTVAARDNPTGAWQCVAEWGAHGDGAEDELMPLYAVDAKTADKLERDLRAFIAEDSVHLAEVTFASQLTRPCLKRP